ncbi:bifunctional nuclease family protein [Microbacterium sp. zg.B48]|uniref:bifunctional nuclease family protein n=1 Tax=unclassified Microbacterium TaxID=2609290 RepID=UPI00214C92A0|nr:MULTISPECIES: bifunctional nuclease family protein [unclassified Microbacterium]MCR2762177.1 bifunctional nuclease family protein [Microbacterium sp. zg.B48]MCR2809816.1 bifunctional nuclease family protein [Microbacterium sp. zg.B185]WIM17874.1 bifunctional nuclease family protein [Microbacterium sp. zg-B185]
MIQVRVAGVALDPTGQHVILLKPLDEIAGEGRILPIWIGQMEATSILVAVEGAAVPRPLAHDLMRSLLDSLDASVTGVAVTRIEEGTFYAEVTLSSSLGQRVVDARPSDAVALASRVGAPIWVADAVMDDAGVPDTVTESDIETELEAELESQLESGAETAIEAEQRLDEFKRFLDDVDPDDFKG